MGRESMTVKKFIKALARSLGVEVTRYSPSSSPSAQLIRALKVAGVNVVFDIGANEGQFAREIREHGYTGKIVSFEPLSSAHWKLRSLSVDDLNWVVHDRTAVGAQDGEAVIHIAGNSVSSSILPMLESHTRAAPSSSYVGSERVPIARLDSLSKTYLTPESKLFIKIDTQGYEWQVLDGAYETLHEARGVLCELSLVPLYQGQKLWRDIVDRLDTYGFVLWAVQPVFTDPRTGQTLQMDGIFLRREVL